MTTLKILSVALILGGFLRGAESFGAAAAGATQTVFGGVLRDDTGLTMQPTGAENKGSGHHREVILTFPRPSMDRKWLELVVKDVAGVKERVFRWDRQ
jgi:hypothetical protein